MEMINCIECNALYDFKEIDANISAFTDQLNNLIAVHSDIEQLKKCGSCNCYFWMSPRTTNKSSDKLQSYFFENHTRLKNYESYTLFENILEDRRQKVVNHLRTDASEAYYLPEFEALKMVLKEEKSILLELDSKNIPGILTEYCVIIADYEDHLDMLNRIFPGEIESNLNIAQKERQKSFARSLLVLKYLLVVISHTPEISTDLKNEIKKVLQNSLTSYDQNQQAQIQKVLLRFD